MRTAFRILCLIVVLIPPPLAHALDTIQVYFSPRGGATAAIVSAIEHESHQIRVAAYSFTSAPIAQALLAAHRRGVSIQVILDSSQLTERYTSATFLSHAGIPVLIDSAHAIAHSKYMILGTDRIITGSFNFTRAAEDRNSENLLVIQNPTLAAQYLDNWATHAGRATPYPR